MGRRLVAFLHLAVPERLREWNVCTNRLEGDLSLGGRRLANLDPGYLAKERLVLATGKNFSHRLYLSQGNYGGLTLTYSRRGFQALPWSYRDYAQEPVRNFLQVVRQKYLWQLKTLA